jgi:hypothetical protein
MSFGLDVIIRLNRSFDPMNLAREFLGCFDPRDVVEVQCERYVAGPGGDQDLHPREEERGTRADAERMVARFFAGGAPGNEQRLCTVSIGNPNEPDPDLAQARSLNFSLMGPDYPFERISEPRYEAALYLDTLQGYRTDPPYILASGRALRDDYLVDLLVRFCTLGSPAAVGFLAEQRVWNPLSYHFVFHADPMDFVRDLRDVLELALRGGAGYHPHDPRHRYEPLVDTKFESMLFCSRGERRRRELLERLAAAAPRLDERGLPEQVDPAVIHEAIVGAPGLKAFTTPTGGLGVHTFTPGKHAWHESYLDEAYLRLIEELAGS